MKKLNKKTFLVLFCIFTSFLTIVLFVYNIQLYKREYMGIKRNLERLIDPHEKNIPRFDDKIIIDYEVYSIDLKNDKIISHTINLDNFNIESIKNIILENYKEDKIKIGNLYINDYAFNLKSGDYLIIINTKEVKGRLVHSLYLSLIIFAIYEFIIYYLSKLLTIYITKPASEAFNKQKDFIADASHELKTPLSIIMASSDEIKITNGNQKYIENIKYESDRMNKLISSLLDLSKTDNETIKKTYVKENISKILEKTVLTFEAVAFDNKVNIKTNIENDIYFNCNKDELEKLFSILIDNAVKHSYPNTTIKVSLALSKNIEVKVINIGDKIAKEDEERIFERFYRSDKSRNRNDNRYGLGLAIAKEIVINHGGIISAYSSEKSQTIFKIIFKR